MFTDYLIKVVWVEKLALIKCCWVAKSIAGLPNIREPLLQKLESYAPLEISSIR